MAEEKVIVECMATYDYDERDYDERFEQQTLTRLSLIGLTLGLIMNFGARRVSESFKRVVNNF